jgi:hypothetical protein
LVGSAAATTGRSEKLESARLRKELGFSGGCTTAQHLSGLLNYYNQRLSDNLKRESLDSILSS